MSGKLSVNFQSTIVAPSLLSCDFMEMANEIDSVLKGGAQWLHLDVMDGHFVPNLTFGRPVIHAIRKRFPQVWLDCHIMVSNPDDVYQEYIAAGVNSLSIPLESLRHAHRVLTQIRRQGVMPGVAINPGTSLSALDALQPYVGFINVMGVNPGFSGQAFIPETLERIKRLRSMIRESGYDIKIQVDGGVDEKTAGQLVRGGADILVSGNYIFSSQDRAITIQSLLNLKGRV